MWLSDPTGFAVIVRSLSKGAVVAALLGLAACTVEPLNGSLATRADGSYANTSTHALLASATIDPVSTRVAQQVRNKLLFALNGGNTASTGPYKIRLQVVASELSLLIGRDSLAPTAAQAVLNARYELIDTQNGKKITRGSRKTFSSFDKTSQSFANERAYRDAQDRAAAEMAQQIRLALLQAVAGQ